MVHFVGAGPGAADLITLRGARLLGAADVVLYAGSLVNPALLDLARGDCERWDSSRMDFGEIAAVIAEADSKGKDIVRLHSGDPSLYGAVREQMDFLEERGIAYDSCPGVSSFCGAAAALNLEYTLPGLSQSVILTRMEGRTPVPERESLESFAAHGSSMVIFLSAGRIPELAVRLQEGGYSADTPAALVYRVSWPDEKKAVCTVGTLARTAEEYEIDRTALILVGEVIAPSGYQRSRLYDPAFSTGFRPGRSGEEEP